MTPRPWAWPALALALWVPVWLLWAQGWAARPEHSHGFLVPLFAAWLAFARWTDSPAPAPPGKPERTTATLVLIAALVFWTAGLLLLTPNPRWPAAQWLGGLGAAGVLLSTVWQDGGGRRAGHFAGAALFPLCAAAWPTMIERPLLDALGSLIANTAAEAVNTAGRLAVAQGSVIEVAQGWVGVDEACSGLRSLDAAVLMAWFIGEQRRFLWRGRIRLLLAALAAAVAGNFARATALVWIAAGSGPEAAAAWHDSLGWAVLACTLGGVLWVAERLETRFRLPVTTPATAAATLRPFPQNRPALAALLATLAGWTLVWSWYSSAGFAANHDGWVLAPAAALDGKWAPEPAPPALETMLGATRWEGLAGTGTNWHALAYVIAWEGDAAAVEGAFLHGPEICLPSVGYRREAPLPAITVRSGGRELELSGARYDDLAGRPQYVWFARWDEHTGRTLGTGRTQTSPLAIRLAAVRERRRHANFAQIGLIVAGPADGETARHRAETWANSLLTRPN